MLPATWTISRKVKSKELSYFKWQKIIRYVPFSNKTITTKLEIFSKRKFHHLLSPVKVSYMNFEDSIADMVTIYLLVCLVKNLSLKNYCNTKIEGLGKFYPAETFQLYGILSLLVNRWCILRIVSHGIVWKSEA